MLVLSIFFENGVDVKCLGVYEVRNVCNVIRFLLFVLVSMVLCSVVNVVCSWVVWLFLCFEMLSI